MNLNPRLLRQAERAWIGLGLIILTGLIGGLLIVAQGRLLSSVIAGVHLQGWKLDTATPILRWLTLVIIGRFLVTWLGEGTAGSVAVRVKNHLRQEVLAKIVRLGPARLSVERSGEITAVLTQGLDSLDAYFSQFLPQLVLAALVPLCVFFFVFPLDWISGLILILTAPLLPIFMILIGSTAEKLTRKQWGALSLMSAQFLETLQGLTALKALNQTQSAEERLRSVSERYRKTTLEVLRVTFLSSLALELVATISVAVVAVQMGLRLLAGGIGFEQALFILVVAPDFYLPLRQLGMKFHSASAGVSAARRIFEILDLPEEAPVQLETSILEVQPGPLEIELRDVTYQFPGRDEPVINGINLRLAAGYVTAVVGRSGAGKSSLANLLLGFIQPTRGAILINHVPLASVNLRAWREQIAWVGQSPSIFSGSIRENILLGRRMTDDENLSWVLAACGLEDWIKSLSHGLETRIGEGGALISSGQAQRLMFCRALLKPARLVVLDEPTAHLDAKLEKELLRAMQVLFAGKTVLLIAHRLPTVMLAQHLVVMDAGRIIEEGEPQTLIKQPGVFQGLVQTYRGIP